MSNPEREAAASDEALAARVRASGDAEAFAVLVTRYRGRLIALSRRMLSESRGGADEAEDVAQEAFVAAYDRRGTYRRGEPFRNGFNERVYSSGCWSAWPTPDPSRSHSPPNAAADAFARAVMNGDHCVAFTPDLSWLPGDIVRIPLILISHSGRSRSPIPVILIIVFTLPEEGAVNSMTWCRTATTDG